MLLRALALLVAISFIPVTAGAEEEPTPEETAEARVHFERARDLENEGEHERAADEYLSAYALYPDPEFFFNAARVYRLAGNAERAVHYYERYLELEPEGRGADTARTQVEALRDEIDKGSGDAESEAATDPAPESRSNEDAAARDGDDSAAGGGERTPAPLDPSGSDASVQDRDSAGGGSRGMRIAGIATGAAGVVALGTSAYFGYRARSLSNDISAFVADDPASWNREMVDKYDEGQRANTTMLILGGVGVAAVTTGSVLYVLSSEGGGAGAETDALSIAPTWSPGAAGVSLRGQF